MNAERNYCPEEYQERITEAGGLNRYDEPNFRIAWGQTETTRVAGYDGYKERLVGLNEPCWMLMQWQPPEKYGLPLAYYLENFDPATGRQFLGEFPYSGKYEIVQPLIAKEIVNGRPQMSFMPLSNYLIDVVIPIIRLAQEISHHRKQAFVAEYEARKEQEKTDHIESAIRDARSGLHEVRSAGYLASKSEVQKRVEAIERHWNRAVKLLRSRPRGWQVN